MPVNIYNLRHRRRDDTLISVAGPAMNILLAAVLVVLAKLASMAAFAALVEALIRVAYISLILAFFNMLPVPPLDGSHVLKNLIRMSDELYLRLSQFGFIIVIVVLQIPLVRGLLGFATAGTLTLMAWLVGLN